MSLINDALKKAQRQQADTPDYTPPMPGGGGSVRKRGTPMAAQTIALIAIGCVVLVAGSIGITVWLMRDKTPAAVAAKPEPAAAAPKTSVTTSTPATTTAPVAVATAPTSSPAPAEKPVPIVAVMPKPIMPVIPESKPEPAPVASAPASTSATSPTLTNTSVAATASSATSSTAEEAPKSSHLASTKLALPDERVHTYLDALRVTGIRSSGNDSRVLMNDKVYRVNDIVDRSLELRLTKVAADSLTFTDANGLVYVKNF